MEIDPVLLSRIQFAFVISFHIIFPSFTIGLASFLAVIEGLWLKTSNIVFKEIYNLWVKIFAVAFAMGVVSGIVMSYQFGTNWSGFGKHVGNILGPIIGYEVMTAFFLESSFLGIMLFGWNKVSPKIHFISTLTVACGTILSGFWILSANSWMHTPSGYTIDSNNIFYPVNWFDIIFNPSFPYRFVHMMLAAFLTTAFVITGVGAYYLLKKKNVIHGKIMLSMGIMMASVVTPVQMVVGDMHGLNTLKYQPAKIAAIESIWEDEASAGLKLFGIPNQEKETTEYVVEVPKIGSLVLTHSLNGVIKGLKNWSKDDRPKVIIIFFAFRIMVGIAVLMFLTGIIGGYLLYKQQLFTSNKFLRWCVFMSPMGFIAILSGWFVTEIGRQPYIVYGLLRTADLHSAISYQSVLFSLIAFILVYIFVFGSGLYYILKLIRNGPNSSLKEYGDISIMNLFINKKNV